MVDCSVGLIVAVDTLRFRSGEVYYLRQVLVHICTSCAVRLDPSKVREEIKQLEESAVNVTRSILDSTASYILVSTCRSDFRIKIQTCCHPSTVALNGTLQSCPKSTEGAIITAVSSSAKFDKLYSPTADHNSTVNHTSGIYNVVRNY